jgi:hypothetical protein
LKKTGPGESSLINKATIASTGETASKNNPLKIISTTRLEAK